MNIKNLCEFSVPIDYYEDCNDDFFCGDIEAELIDNQFYFKLGVLIGKNKVFYSYDVVEYFNYILEKKFIKNVYFHNLDFDFLFFMRECDIPPSTKLIHSGNMLLQANFLHHKTKLTNSLSILPMSLKSVVNNLLGIKWDSWEKQKGDIFGLDNDELLEYCFRDTFLLYKSVKNIKGVISNEFGIKNFLTIPSLSLKIMKKISLDNKWFTSSHRLNFFRKDFYFGGHTEKFVEGEYFFRDLNYVDVNSLYPFIMRDLHIGVDVPSFITPSMDNLEKCLKEGYVFYALLVVDVKTDRERIFVSKHGDRNCYLFGRQEVKVSSITIKYLYDNDMSYVIKDVINILRHKKKVKPFRSFVEKVYPMRAINLSYSVIMKLVLNGAYGRFGMKEKMERCDINIEDVSNCDKLVVYKDNLLSYSTEYIEGHALKYIRYDIAGLVTEGARVYMAGMRNELNKTCEVVYMDTDSFMIRGKISAEFKDKYVDQKELGKLKFENDTPLSGVVVGQKVYSLFDKNGKLFQASKGLKNITHDDMLGLALLMSLRGVNFVLDNPCKGFCVRIYIVPRNRFYNTRFTKFKTLIRKSFFGLQILPFEVVSIRERLDSV